MSLKSTVTTALSTIITRLTDYPEGVGLFRDNLNQPDKPMALVTGQPINYIPVALSAGEVTYAQETYTGGDFVDGRDGTYWYHEDDEWHDDYSGGLLASGRFPPGTLAYSELGDRWVYQNAEGEDFQVINQSDQAEPPPVILINTVNGLARELSTGPSRRRRHAMTSHDGVLYLAGGQEEDSETPNDLWLFDTDTESWSQGANLSQGVKEHSLDVVDDTIILLGGRTMDNGGNDAVDMVERYDVATDSWSSGAAMPERRYSHASATVDGSVYLLGGFDASDNESPTILVYNVADDSWSTRDFDPPPRQQPKAAVVDGLIYLYGGSSGDTYYEDLWTYDPVADNWEEITFDGGPGPLDRHVMDTIGGVIYLFSGNGGNNGENGDNDKRNTYWEYDPPNNTWTERDLQDGESGNSDPIDPRQVAASAVVGTDWYIHGGNTAMEDGETAYDDDLWVIR